MPVSQQQAEKRFFKDLVTTYSYMLLWIALSAIVILFNKFILSSLEFHHPITLTMIHMFFCSVLAALLIFTGVVKPINMPMDTYLKCVVPIAGLFSLVLWFGNAAYIYLSVSFIQMVKACMPVAVYLVGQAFQTETFSVNKSVNMLVITIGVAIASYGEIAFDWTGFGYQMSSIACESTRLTLIQILLQRQGIKMNPIHSLYYVAPACFVFLCIPFSVVEAQQVIPVIGQAPRVILLLNAICAFGLNLSVFLLIGKTSALTMNIAGVIKDWLLIFLSWFLFKSPISFLNLGGYFISFLGVGYFNYNKIQSMKKQAVLSAKTDSEEESVKEPMVQRVPSSKV